MKNGKIIPYCRHHGERNCYALDPMTCKCLLLTDTYWIDGCKDGMCPFYKNEKEIKHESKEYQLQYPSKRV